MLCSSKWKKEGKRLQSVWCHRLFVSLPHFLFFTFAFIFLYPKCIPFIFALSIEYREFDHLFKAMLSLLVLATGNELHSFQLTEFHLRWSLALFFFWLTFERRYPLNLYAKRALSIEHWILSSISIITFGHSI